MSSDGQTLAVSEVRSSSSCDDVANYCCWSLQKACLAHDVPHATAGSLRWRDRNLLVLQETRSPPKSSVTDSDDQSSADGRSGSFSIAVNGSNYCVNAQTDTAGSVLYSLLSAHYSDLSGRVELACKPDEASVGDLAVRLSCSASSSSCLRRQCSCPQESLFVIPGCSFEIH